MSVPILAQALDPARIAPSTARPATMSSSSDTHASWGALRRERKTSAARRDHEQMMRRLNDVEDNMKALFKLVQAQQATMAGRVDSNHCDQFFIGDADPGSETNVNLDHKLDQVLAGIYFLLPKHTVTTLTSPPGALATTLEATTRQDIIAEIDDTTASPPDSISEVVGTAAAPPDINMIVDTKTVQPDIIAKTVATTSVNLVISPASAPATSAYNPNGDLALVLLALRQAHAVGQFPRPRPDAQSIKKVKTLRLYPPVEKAWQQLADSNDNTRDPASYHQDVLNKFIEQFSGPG